MFTPYRNPCNAICCQRSTVHIENSVVGIAKLCSPPVSRRCELWVWLVREMCRDSASLWDASRLTISVTCVEAHHLRKMCLDSPLPWDMLRLYISARGIEAHNLCEMCRDSTSLWDVLRFTISTRCVETQHLHEMYWGSRSPRNVREMWRDSPFSARSVAAHYPREMCRNSIFPWDVTRLIISSYRSGSALGFHREQIFKK